MHKKHIFLRVFSKITIFACVFCTISAWAETTTCDINYTPVTGNSIQNGTPTPTTPVAIESIGTKVGNKYAVQVAVNYDGGVVDMGTLNWVKSNTYSGVFNAQLNGAKPSDWGNTGNLYLLDYATKSVNNVSVTESDLCIGINPSSQLYVKDARYADAISFKQAMSGKMLYYQRTTDETWTAPITTPIYLNAPLRKVGDYADVLDYKNGTITRNVGVKVLDGTENWGAQYAGYFNISFSNYVPFYLVYCTHFKGVNTGVTPDVTKRDGTAWLGSTWFGLGATDRFQTITDFKAYLASEYAKGTPVIVYYPLATPVVEQIENWSCTPPITDIKIATTKMVDEEFAAAEAKLAATVQTIESVVSRTITQTGQIATLHETKQTRPDESCPANMKCLLVQDEDGTPHWYPIIEP
ncbi:MAG: hypothetical protein MJ164_03080 [Alphaproteobacteria bacterium]|nr:hypothetical protein [Alphaproteobacteria bacterium]